jgi:hypothetical protein
LGKKGKNQTVGNSQTEGNLTWMDMFLLYMFLPSAMSLPLLSSHHNIGRSEGEEVFAITTCWVGLGHLISGGRAMTGLAIISGRSNH